MATEFYYSPELKDLRVHAGLPETLDWKRGLLVRSTNWLGDALMTLPAVYQMKRQLPNGAELAVLTPANLAPMWRAVPFVSNVFPMKEKRLRKEELTEINNWGAGASVILPNSFGSALDIWKTNVPVRIGRRGRWRKWLLTDCIREWPRGENVGVCHQLSYYLELASFFGNVDLSVECPTLKVDSALAQSLGVSSSSPWLAVAPGAAFGTAKQWPADCFLEVARRFSERYGRVVILGGGKERPVADVIASQLPGALNLAGKTDLAQLMSVLASSRIVLANDSGAMHLAAALGSSGIAVFGSTDPVATGPIGGRWKLFVAEADCRPCFQRTCPLDGTEHCRCLRETTPDMVFSAIMNEMDKQ